MLKHFKQYLKTWTEIYSSIIILPPNLDIRSVYFYL